MSLMWALTGMRTLASWWVTSILLPRSRLLVPSPRAGRRGRRDNGDSHKHVIEAAGAHRNRLLTTRAAEAVVSPFCAEAIHCCRLISSLKEDAHAVHNDFGW